MYQHATYRFHLLAEFDNGKRSCRKRLAGHNERRRKPQPENHSRRIGKLLPSCHRIWAYTPYSYLKDIILVLVTVLAYPTLQGPLFSESSIKFLFDIKNVGKDCKKYEINLG